MAVVLCFGDSNTHGTPPIVDIAVYGRFGPGVRWPSRVGQALGCEMIEAGLPGRTAQFDDPIMGAHMNGQAGLKIALESHGPLDALVLPLMSSVPALRSMAGSRTSARAVCVPTTNIMPKLRPVTITSPGLQRSWNPGSVSANKYGTMSFGSKRISETTRIV